MHWWSGGGSSGSFQVETLPPRARTVGGNGHGPCPGCPTTVEDPVSVSKRGSLMTSEPTTQRLREWGVCMVPALLVVEVPRESQRAASTTSAAQKETGVGRKVEVTSVAFVSLHFI
mmetsp:Transcript_16570/g.47708  ORF Transcript_16570/g.47708 Transcript_16570/m.47708 type:complete len:116 (-) Transcript_16570:13-360(-)